MNIKIFISLILFVSTHHNFCMMITSQSNKQNNIETIKKNIANIKLNTTMERSLEENHQRYLIKIATQSQPMPNYNKTGPLFNVITLPKDTQITILSHFFDNQDKIAAEHFFKRPLEAAIKKYNKPSWLKRNKKLPNGMIFLLTDEQEKDITNIYLGNDISKKNYCNLINNLEPHILNELYQQKLVTNLATGANPIKELLLVPYKTLSRTPLNIVLNRFNISWDIAPIMLFWKLCKMNFMIGNENLNNTIIKKFFISIPLDTAGLLMISFIAQFIPDMITHHKTTTQPQQIPFGL